MHELVLYAEDISTANNVNSWSSKVMLALLAAIFTTMICVHNYIEHYIVCVLSQLTCRLPRFIQLGLTFMSLTTQAQTCYNDLSVNEIKQWALLGHGLANVLMRKGGVARIHKRGLLWVRLKPPLENSGQWVCHVFVQYVLGQSWNFELFILSILIHYCWHSNHLFVWLNCISAFNNAIQNNFILQKNINTGFQTLIDYFQHIKKIRMWEIKMLQLTYQFMDAGDRHHKRITWCQWLPQSFKKYDNSTIYPLTKKRR